MLFPRRLVIPLILLAMTGCGGGKYPVHGTVTLEDGTPLARGMVVAERFDGGPPVTAQGAIGPDGRYELSTEKPGDGVPPGKYKVLIQSMDLSDVPDERKGLPFDVKYLKFATSGLECEVKAGGTEFPIKLDRPARKGR